MVTQNDPLIVILGETASGKSALALDLADKYRGEIICADSRTIYKYLDIGTAKPTDMDQIRVPHHMLSIVEPNQNFNVAAFQKMTKDIMKGISNRENVSILVGGSGMYIDSIIFNYKFGKSVDINQRSRLEANSLEELQLKARSIGLSEKQINFANKRYLIRAIENSGMIKQVNKLRPNTLIIGLAVDREVLKQRITDRVEMMFNAGFTDEVRRVVKTYGWDNEAMTGIGYRAVRRYIDEQIDINQAKANFIHGDLLLAKKQRTWFKRNKYIHWISHPSQADILVSEFMNKTN